MRYLHALLSNPNKWTQQILRKAIILPISLGNYHLDACISMQKDLSHYLKIIVNFNLTISLCCFIFFSGEI